MSEQLAQPWFDLDEGVLLIGKAAIQGRFQAGASNLMPLEELVLDPDFDVATYGYPKVNTSDWSKVDVENYGLWAASILPHFDQRAGFNRNHLRRLAALGIGPGKELLKIARSPNMAEFKDRIGLRTIHFRGKYDTWDESDFQNYGREVARSVGRKPAPQDYATYFDEKPRDRPSISAIQKHIGGTSVLNELIGYPNTHKRFAHWTLNDFAKHARRLENALGREPSGLDYQEKWLQDPGKYPAFSTIMNKITIGALHEFLGYPDVKSWESSDYIAWGVKIMRSNDGLMLTPRIMNSLCRKGRAPSDFAIRSHFVRWSLYKSEVLARYEADELDRFVKLQTYRAEVTTQSLPLAIAEVSDEELLAYGGRARLIRAAGVRKAELPMTALASGSSMTRYIRRQNPEISVADIETLALAEGVSEDVWPLADLSLPHLRLNEEELADLFGNGPRRYFDNSTHLFAFFSGKLEGLKEELEPHECLALVGKAIQAKRLLAGHSRESFSKQASMSKSYLRAIELGDIDPDKQERRYSNPSREVLTAIARHLDLNIDHVLELVGHAA